MNEQIRNALSSPNVEFFFVPSAYLKQVIASGLHPINDFLSPEEKSDLLSGHGLAMETQLVMDFLDRKLNNQLLFILDNSEIRVLGAEEVILQNKGKVSAS